MNVNGKLVLGRFRVLRTLAEQTTFQLLLGVDNRREGASSAVVIRLYREPLGRGRAPAQVALFERLSTIAQMRQRGVSTLLDFGQFEGRLVMVSPHRPGIPLSDLCGEHSSQLQGAEEPLLTANMAVAIVRSLCESHQKLRDNFGSDSLHGRISPQCVYLPLGDVPELNGLAAKIIDNAASETEAPIGGMQHAVGYAAPEVLRGSPPDEAADVYALTLVLYRLLSRSNPFSGRTVSETLQRVMAMVPARLTRLGDNSSKLNDVLAQGLEKDPARRFASVGELAQALANCTAGSIEKQLRAVDALVESRPWTAWRSSIESERVARLEELDTEPVFRPLVGANGMPVDSGFPAFASGLLTEQPRSVSEHTHAHTRQLGPLKRWRSAVAIGVPAAALLIGLVLGRVEPRQVEPGEFASPASASSELVGNAPRRLAKPVAALRRQVQVCTGLSERPQSDVRLLLRLDFAGAVEAVDVEPEIWRETRAGACAVKAAWGSPLTMPGAKSLVVPVVWSPVLSTDE